MSEIKLVKRIKYAGDVHTALMALGWDVKTAAAFLDSIPDADAEKVFEAVGLVQKAFDMAKSSLVPVVRCENCVHQQKAWHSDKRMKEKGFFMYRCELNQDPFVSHAVDGDPGSFCSEGERKVEDEAP